MKNLLKYPLILPIIIACILSYHFFKAYEEKRFIEKEIVYSSDVAAEVDMVWGINYSQLPPKDLWPQGSYVKNGLVHSKMEIINGNFKTKISLPNKTILNYWMVQRKDKNGSTKEIWDAGGAGKDSYFVTFTDDSLFRPGYFLFLAGFLPLLILYYKNSKTTPNAVCDKLYKLKTYIPQLDSIRAIAVLLVVIHHWLPKNSFLNILPNGSLGVTIFFVLSGFLITSILLKSKKQIDAQSLKTSTVFKNFYIRRTLRIFPIYYLVIFILYLLKDSEIEENGIYYLTYTANYLFYSKQFFSHLSHFWSLAVEEQFYLLWPALILLTNKKYLPYLIVLFIVIGISSNYIFTNSGYWVFIFTPACFDAFSIGALLSYLVAYRQDIIEQIQSKYIFLASLSFIVFVLSLRGFSFLPARTIQSLLAIVIIYYCIFKNNNKFLNYILNNKWLIRIGKISYGVYLYHFFTPSILSWIIKHSPLNLEFPNIGSLKLIKPYWVFTQDLLFLFFVCYLSWIIIEKPINNLKTRFENKPFYQKSYS